MKYLFLLAAMFTTSFSFAQAKDRVKEKPYKFVIEGEVNNKITFTLDSVAKYTPLSLDSFVVYNHLMERRKAYKDVKGFLLTDAINAAGIKMDKAKLLSEFYFTCVSYDGYKVVFSWNELFNTPVGKKVMIVTSINGKSEADANDGIVLLSGADEASGRRLVYDVKKIIVSRVP